MASIHDATLREEVNELHQTNGNLQWMMEEILRWLQPQASSPSDATAVPSQPFDFPEDPIEEDFENSSSSSVMPSPRTPPTPAWAIDRLAQAENANKSIRVDVPDFNDKLRSWNLLWLDCNFRNFLWVEGINRRE